jgi:hypothetical protein
VLFLANRKAKYFLAEDWTGIRPGNVICPSGRSRIGIQAINAESSSPPHRLPNANEVAPGTELKPPVSMPVGCWA